MKQIRQGQGERKERKKSGNYIGSIMHACGRRILWMVLSSWSCNVSIATRSYMEILIKYPNWKINCSADWFDTVWENMNEEIGIKTIKYAISWLTALNIIVRSLTWTNDDSWTSFDFHFFEEEFDRSILRLALPSDVCETSPWLGAKGIFFSINSKMGIGIG